MAEQKQVAEQKPMEVKWLDQPEEHDYPAAQSYLCLIFPPKQVEDIVRRLRKSRPQGFKAKDIARASGLSLLGISNFHVEKDRQAILAGKALSPILLVRDGQKVVIADGYHRMCAVYLFAEDGTIPCRIVSAKTV